MIFYSQVLIILLVLIHSCTSKECRKSANCGWCGFCVESNTSTSCYYPFDDFTSNKGNKCYSKSFCTTEKVCQNGGRCSDGFGYQIPRCYCDAKNYGELCEHETPKGQEHNLATGFAVFASLIRKQDLELYKNVYSPVSYRGTGYVFRALVVVSTMFRGSKLKIRVSTSEGFEAILCKSLGSCSANRKKYKELLPYKYENDCAGVEVCHRRLPDDCKDLYIATVDFPANQISRNEVTLITSKENRALGYLAKINVTATNHRTNVFSHEFQIMVYINYLEYYYKNPIPDIQVAGCSRFLEGRKSYFRFVDISWEATINTPSQDNLLDWSVWNYKDVFSQGRCVEFPKLEMSFQTRGTSKWVIPRFKLKAGTYKMRLDVEYLAKHMAQNFAECYFNIRNKQLIVRLSGGSRRSVGKDRGIVVSGVGSYDPNEPKDKQNHLQYSWRCSPNCDKLIRSTGQTMTIMSQSITAGETYKITLTVSAPGLTPESASQEIFVIVDDFDISIECISNCHGRVTPTEVLLLGVKTSLNVKKSTLGNFTWTYILVNDADKSIHSVEDIYDDKYTSDLLCIKKNSLKPGKIYHFEASNGKYNASIEVTVESESKNGSCTVSPPSGTLGKTLFTITCSGYDHEDELMVYEYFNKYKFEPVEGFNGRMLGTNYGGFLDNVRLTREVVVVIIHSLYGQRTVSISEVMLTHEDVPTTPEINSNLTEIKEIAQTGNTEEAMKRITEVSDILPENTNDTCSDQFRNIIEIMKIISFQTRQSPENTPSQINFCLLSLKCTLINLVLKGYFERQISATKIVADYIRMLCDTFKGMVQENSTLRITLQMLSDVVKCILDLNESLLTHKAGIFPSMNEQNEMDSTTFTDLKDIYDSFRDTMNDLIYVTSFRQSSRLERFFLQSNSTLSYLIVLTDSPSEASAKVNKDEKFLIHLSKDLLGRLGVRDCLTIQTTVVKMNPAFSEISMGWLCTNLIGVDMFEKLEMPDEYPSRMKPLKILPQPIDLFLNVETTYSHALIHHSTKQPNISNTDNQDYLDILVDVIRVDVPQRCKMFVKFILNDTSDELRVSIQHGLRPSYEVMMTRSKLINASSPTYDVPYIIVNDNEFMYIGVLPGPNVPPAKTVKFTADLFCNTCLTRFRNSWVTKFCTVGHMTNESMIHCRCNHLSFFSSIFVVPPHKIDPLDDFESMLKVKDNPEIVIYVVCVWLVFSFLCVLAILLDRKQSAAREIIILEDNFPDDKYWYVVAVFTGSRFFAGTCANIGIQITGTTGRSRAHILKKQGQKTFRYNADDWFLISTPTFLGTITHLHIWHDSKGMFPDWFCEKVLLYDLHTLTVYTFFAHEWIALEGDKFPEAILIPATADDFRSLHRIFFENLRHGITHCHILSSILARHRDIKLTKLDRVMIIWSIIMTASVIGIAFYKVDTNEYDGVDDPHYSFGTTTIIKGSEIFILNIIFVTIFQLMFKKSYRLEDVSNYKDFTAYEKPSSFITSLTSDKQVYSAYLKAENRSYMTYYEKFVQMIYKVYRPMKHQPVVLSTSSHGIRRRLVLYVLAWICSVFTIVLCSYLIIEFGLKIGEVKCKKWISQIVVSMVNHFIVLVPLKIVLVAVILASHFVALVPISNYKIKIGSSTKTHPKDQTKYGTVLNKRHSNIYHPLSLEATSVKRRRRAKLLFVLNVVNIVFHLTIVIVLGLLANWNREYFHTNENIEILMKSHPYEQEPSVSTITNKTEFLNYLLDIFIKSDSLYRKRWYNLQSLSAPHLQDVVSWTSDCTHQLIGLPVLRQLRVCPNACTINDHFEAVIPECIPVWSLDVQDTGNYGFEWTRIVWVDAATPWTYETPSESELPYSDSIVGLSYPRGGYVAELGDTRYDTSTNLMRLLDGHWVDQYSRVVFGAFTVYNVNVKMFTQVRLVAEHLPSGFYMVRIQARSTSFTLIEMLFNAVYSIYVITLTVRTGFSLHRHGLRDFMSRFKNVFQFLLILVGIAAVVFVVIRYVVAAEYITDFQQDESAVVFNSYHIIRFQDISNNLSIFFYGGLVIRLFTLWTFGRLYMNVISTLRGMTIPLIIVSVFFVIVCYMNWKMLYFLNLLSFSDLRCISGWYFTVSAWKCLEGTPANAGLYAITRIISWVLLVLTLNEYKAVKYKPK